jgi:starch synthase
VRILFATPEFEDLVRVGGLAAVSAALPRALRPYADVRIILPGYRGVLDGLSSVELVGSCEPWGALPGCSIARGATADGMIVYVVLCSELYERIGTPYADSYGNDWSDNDVRFARFALAAAHVAAGRLDRSWQADLVHANDWPSALVPAYLAWHGVEMPSILTIHNLAYQGLFGQDSLGRIGAPESAFHMEGVEFYGHLSFLKAGLVYASHLTTVSETYAAEITTQAFGHGLEGLLAKRSAAGQLTGILNGIDESWDPLHCPALAAPFGPGEWQGKQVNADHLRREFGLALSRGPLFGVVARLVHQKGIDLVLSAADAIVEAGGQLVVTGRGEAGIENGLQELHKRHPESVAAALEFEDEQARRIFAGSDFTLMPSRYEPCGLSQMYAQRFGSLPIGHRTGGLAETIVDGETGFLFGQSSTQSLMGAVGRAFATFGRKRQLNSMRSHAMARTFSWKASASRYRNLYKTVCAGGA